MINTNILSLTVSELSQLIVQMLDTFRFVHLWLIGKRVVDFVLVLNELLSLGVAAEALRAKNVENRRFRSNAVSFILNFR